VLNVFTKNFLDMVVNALVFWAVGYAFAYGDSNNHFIGMSNFFLVDTNAALHWFSQWVFATNASTIFGGAVAGRTKFGAYMAVAAVTGSWIYPVVCHWVRRNNKRGGCVLDQHLLPPHPSCMMWLSLSSVSSMALAHLCVALSPLCPSLMRHQVWTSDGWLARLGPYGLIDFAGSGVVHMCGGTIGLVVRAHVCVCVCVCVQEVYTYRTNVTAFARSFCVCGRVCVCVCVWAAGPYVPAGRHGVFRIFLRGHHVGTGEPVLSAANGEAHQFLLGPAEYTAEVAAVAEVWKARLEGPLGGVVGLRECVEFAWSSGPIVSCRPQIANLPLLIAIVILPWHWAPTVAVPRACRARLLTRYTNCPCVTHVCTFTDTFAAEMCHASQK